MYERSTPWGKDAPCSHEGGPNIEVKGGRLSSPLDPFSRVELPPEQRAATRPGRPAGTTVVCDRPGRRGQGARVGREVEFQRHRRVGERTDGRRRPRMSLSRRRRRRRRRRRNRPSGWRTDPGTPRRAGRRREGGPSRPPPDPSSRSCPRQHVAVAVVVVVVGAISSDVHTPARTFFRGCCCGRRRRLSSSPSSSSAVGSHGAGGRGELPSSRGGRCFFSVGERRGGREGGVTRGGGTPALCHFRR
jgi:hypothetical protein